jgi:KaiC/GvpD/RAD55 family RecA-like ATPase
MAGPAPRTAGVWTTVGDKVSETRRLPRAQRLPTGADGLDTILRGGLLPGSVYVLQGPPGAGKTILANQICFHFSPISAVAQNILMLRYLELESDTKRILNFIKVRKSRFDSRIREFHITDKGIALGQTFRHSERPLTGHAQRQSGGAEDARDR